MHCGLVQSALTHALRELGQLVVLLERLGSRRDRCKQAVVNWGVAELCGCLPELVECASDLAREGRKVSSRRGGVRESVTIIHDRGVTVIHDRGVVVDVFVSGSRAAPGVLGIERRAGSGQRGRVHHRGGVGVTKGVGATGGTGVADGVFVGADGLLAGALFLHHLAVGTTVCGLQWGTALATRSGVGERLGGVNQHRLGLVDPVVYGVGHATAGFQQLHRVGWRRDGTLGIAQVVVGRQVGRDELGKLGGPAGLGDVLTAWASVSNDLTKLALHVLLHLPAVRQGHLQSRHPACPDGFARAGMTGVSGRKGRGGCMGCMRGRARYLLATCTRTNACAPAGIRWLHGGTPCFLVCLCSVLGK